MEEPIRKNRDIFFLAVPDFHNAVETYASHFERTAADLNKLVAPSSSAGQGQGTVSYHQGIIGMYC